MDDDKYFSIPIKGTAYRFRPIPEDSVSTLLVILNMGASVDRSVKALMRALGASAGPEQWDAITDRLIEGELTVHDVTIDLFRELVRRQGKDAGVTVKARRPRKARAASPSDGE